MAYKKRSKYGKRYKRKYRKFRSRRRGGLLFNTRTRVGKNSPFVLGNKKIVYHTYGGMLNATVNSAGAYNEIVFHGNDPYDPAAAFYASSATGFTNIAAVWEHGYVMASEAIIDFACLTANESVGYAVWFSADDTTVGSQNQAVGLALQHNGRTGIYTTANPKRVKLKCYPGKLVNADWKEPTACCSSGSSPYPEYRVYVHVVLMTTLQSTAQIKSIVNIQMNLKTLWHTAKPLV